MGTNFRRIFDLHVPGKNSHFLKRSRVLALTATQGEII